MHIVAVVVLKIVIIWAFTQQLIIALPPPPCSREGKRAQRDTHTLTHSLTYSQYFDIKRKQHNDRDVLDHNHGEAEGGEGAPGAHLSQQGEGSGRGPAPHEDTRYTRQDAHLVLGELWVRLRLELQL